MSKYEENKVRVNQWENTRNAYLKEQNKKRNKKIFTKINKAELNKCYIESNNFNDDDAPPRSSFISE